MEYENGEVIGGKSAMLPACVGHHIRHIQKTSKPYNSTARQTFSGRNALATALPGQSPKPKPQISKSRVGRRHHGLDQKGAAIKQQLQQRAGAGGKRSSRGQRHQAELRAMLHEAQVGAARRTGREVAARSSWRPGSGKQPLTRPRRQYRQQARAGRLGRPVARQSRT